MVPKMILYHEMELPNDQDIKTFNLARAVNRCAKFAHQKMGELWHQKFLPLHFGANASARYGYQERTEGYRRRKVPGKTVARRTADHQQRRQSQVYLGHTFMDRIEGGPNDANVYTGALRRTMLKSPSFKAYPTRVTISMPALPYIIKSNPQTSNRGRQPDKQKEITGTFTEQEMQELTREFEHQFWFYFLSQLSRKRLVITGGAVAAAP